LYRFRSDFGWTEVALTANLFREKINEKTASTNHSTALLVLRVGLNFGPAISWNDNHNQFPDPQQMDLYSLVLHDAGHAYFLPGIYTYLELPGAISTASRLHKVQLQFEGETLRSVSGHWHSSVGALTNNNQPLGGEPTFKLSANTQL